MDSPYRVLDLLPLNRNTSLERLVWKIILKVQSDLLVVIKCYQIWYHLSNRLLGEKKHEFYRLPKNVIYSLYSFFTQEQRTN